MFIVSLHYIGSIEQIDALLERHSVWLKTGYTKGLFLASGRKIPRTGGIILAHGDRSTLEHWLTQDPFAESNVARYEITEFIPTMTAPELDAIKEALP